MLLTINIPKKIVMTLSNLIMQHDCIQQFILLIIIIVSAYLTITKQSFRHKTGNDENYSRE